MTTQALYVIIEPMIEYGKLIVLEGIDDALLEGLAEALCRWLREQQVAVEHTREPTYGPAGSQVLLARQDRVQYDPVSLSLVCLADRLDHLDEGGMLAWLEQGRHVVCAHYALSAYARLWDQVDWVWLRQIDAFCRAPDLTLLVDSVSGEMTPLRAAYLQVSERLQAEGQSIVVVDGRAAQEEVLAVCQQQVAGLLEWL